MKDIYFTRRLPKRNTCFKIDFIKNQKRNNEKDLQDRAIQARYVVLNLIVLLSPLSLLNVFGGMLLLN